MSAKKPNPAAKMVRFNVNDFVWVRLTALGRKTHRSWFRELFSGALRIPVFTPAKEDAKGWSRWQLWELFQVFGKHMGNGFPLMFKTTMRVEIEDVNRRARKGEV